MRLRVVVHHVRWQCNFHAKNSFTGYRFCSFPSIAPGQTCCRPSLGSLEVASRLAADQIKLFNGLKLAFRSAAGESKNIVAPVEQSTRLRHHGRRETPCGTHFAAPRHCSRILYRDATLSLTQQSYDSRWRTRLRATARSWPSWAPRPELHGLRGEVDDRLESTQGISSANRPGEWVVSGELRGTRRVGRTSRFMRLNPCMMMI